MRLPIILIIVAFLLLAFAATGQARELTPAERAEISDVAGRAFPDSPCFESVQIAFVHVVVPDARDTRTVAAVTSGGWTLRGYADGLLAGTCKVQVQSDLPPIVACTTATHEAGHLAGLAHGSSALMGTPDSPDHPGGDTGSYVWPACNAMVTLGLDDALSYMWNRFPDSAVQCNRQTASRFQCIRHRDDSKTRQVYRVWATGPDAFTGARIGSLRTRKGGTA